MSSTGWSEWEPHPDTEGWQYRWRYDSKGQPKYEQRPVHEAQQPAQSAQTTSYGVGYAYPGQTQGQVRQQQQQTPRTGIEESMSNLALGETGGSTTAASHYGYQQSPPTTTYQQPSSTTAQYPSGYERTQYAAGAAQSYAPSTTQSYTPSATQSQQPQYPSYGASPQQAYGATGYSTAGYPQYTTETQPAHSAGEPQSAAASLAASSQSAQSPHHPHAVPSSHSRASRKGKTREHESHRESHESRSRRKDKGRGHTSQPTEPFYPANSEPGNKYYASGQAPEPGYTASAQSPTPSYYTASPQDPGTESGASVTGSYAPAGSQAAGSITTSRSSGKQPYSQAPSLTPYGTQGYGEDDEEDSEDEDQLREAIRVSREEASTRVYNDPFANEGEPSATPSGGYSDPAYVPEPTYERDPGYDINPNSYGAPEEEPYGGATTPRANSPDPYYPGPTGEGQISETITGTGELSDRLDSRFQIHHSSQFDVGRVFKILWSDPKGGSASDNATDVIKFQDAYGELFYIGIRRFIIIASDEGNSTCVPILTYRGHGCRKNGVKARMHGIIYGSNDKSSRRSKPLEGEPRPGFHSVCMRVTAPGEKLARESRVNYAKLVTIEHNVKVFFIGRLEGEDFEIAKDAVDRCWSYKTREPKRHKH